MKRLFIEESRTIVALDTTVIRELCYKEPDWLPVFIKMSNNQFDFCLSDHLIAEFINQLERKSITEDQYQKAIHNISTFISKRLPILPSNRELFGMCAILDEKSFSPKDTYRFYHLAWKLLCSSQNLEDLSKGIEITMNGERQLFSLKKDTVDKLLDEERGRWIDFFNYLNIFPEDTLKIDKDKIIDFMKESVDKVIGCTPPLSTRLDVVIRHKFRQVELMNRGRYPYDPESKKKRNDAIDFYMDFVFMLPALLCTSDKDYYNVIKEINSFQSRWIYKPDELSKAWRDGSVSTPSW